jgi:serine/threonine-protein kinase
MPRLVVEKGNDKGKTINIPVRGTILIGRDSSAALQVRDSMTSRLHIKIESRENGEYWLHDLESLNGTLLNGQRIRESKLNAGDLIKIGETLISFLSDDAQVDPLVGQRVGGYLVMDRVGRGGMGTVYRAEQVDLQRIVALKVMSDEHTRDKDFVDLFIHEARAAAKLNHPNVVQVYDVKRHNSLYYISMEFVSGGSVQDILNRQRKMPVGQAVQIIAEAARGLEYAHKKGIVHRDVKPDNLMLSDAGMTKIGDMGLARGLNEKVGPEEETSVIGTPHYIAPEQVLGEQADFRSDIYSLGATMYRMLTGVTPYQAPSVRDLVNKKVREDAPPAHEMSPEVPKSLSEILARMMARDPGRRYQDMGEVAAALERWQKEVLGQAAEARREHSTSIDQLVKNRKVLAGALAAGLLVLAGLGYAFFPRTPAVPPPPPVNPPPPSEERAKQSLEFAQLWEIKSMDKGDVRSIQKAIDQFTRVMDEFPRTPQSIVAAEHRAGLEKILRELRGRKRLEALELEDVAHYSRLKSGFHPRRPDLAPASDAANAYQKLADDEELRGTAAGEQASRRANHIRSWATEVERMHGDYERLLSRVQETVRQNRFREAASAVATFQKSLRDSTPACEFARDRYMALLYEPYADAEAKQIEEKALVHWEGVRSQAESLNQEKSFDEALRLLDPVIQTSTKPVADLARKLQKEVETAREDFAQQEAALRNLEREERLKKAREAFEAESVAAYNRSVRYDFKGALQKVKNLRENPAIEDYRTRLDRRVAELERADHFKKSLLLAINDREAFGPPRSLFKTEYVRSSTLDGTIERADDASFMVGLKAGGTEFVPWDQFDPPAFYQFIRTQWKYNDRQMSKDLNDLCDLAAACMEVGLYEEAKKDLDYVVAKATADSEAQRAFAEEYRARIEKGETAECDEVEAQKRLSRLDWFMKAQKTAAAKAEIALLKTRYAKTKAYADAKPAIDRHLEVLNKKASLESDKGARELVLERLQAFVSDQQAAARKSQVDVLTRVARLEDSLERNLHAGSVYAAFGEWSKAVQAYTEARRLCEGLVDGRHVGKEFHPYLAFLYSEIYRISVLQKNGAAAAAVRNEGARRFVNAETKAEEEWWTLTVKRLETWAEKVYPEQVRTILRLKDEMKNNPEDPQKIWAVAIAYHEGLINALESRGYFAYLLQNHPDFTLVKNGECRWRLAEVLYASREVREAAKLYRDLVQQSPEHPRVKDEGPEGVKSRLDECRKLAEKFGIGKERPR